jgi:hypothetical protein
MPRFFAPQTAYGLSSPTPQIFPPPIVKDRAPTITDLAEVGRTWVDTTNEDAYTCVRLFATGVFPDIVQSATWINSGGGSGVFSSLTVDPGPIDFTGTFTENGDSTFNGNITCTGQGTFDSLIVDTGDIDVPTGDINVSSGSVNAVQGGFSGVVTAADFSSETGFTAGSLSIPANGSVLLFAYTDDNVGSQLSFDKNRLGGVLTTGDQLGSIVFEGFDGSNYVGGARIEGLATGTIAAGQVPGFLRFSTASGTGVSTTRMVIDEDGLITINSPDIGTISVSSLGDVHASQLVATADTGGFITNTTFTNTDVTSAPGGGALTIDSQSVNPGVNAGFIKIYVGNTTAYIPYFTNISP